MWRKKSKIQNVAGDTLEHGSLVVPGHNDKPFMEFPAEMVDSLRRMIARVGRDGAFPKRLAVMASLRGEGTTSVSRALAATLAHDLGATVCVVELNWWWPAPWLASIPEAHSLAAVLTGTTSLDEAMVPTGWPNLTVLPAGKVAMTRRSMLAHSSILKEVINELSARFDHLILDLPAVLAANDAMPLASLGTAVCLVVRQGVTSIEDAKSALDDIGHLPILGVIINREKLATPSALLRLVPQN